ncbi:MAG: hypothetical protein ACO1QR_09550 [Chthoniobacteraceae bacterium]
MFERQKRAEYLRLMKAAPALVAGTFKEMREMMGLVGDLMDMFIPPIPTPPKM